MKRVTFTPLSVGFMLAGLVLRNKQLGKSGGGLAFLRHQKREPARVRFRREAQSGEWHRPHGPSGYPSTPLPRGTDGLRANRSTHEGNLATVGVEPADPKRVETSAFTPRRMSYESPVPSRYMCTSPRLRLQTPARKTFRSPDTMQAPVSGRCVTPGLQ